MIGKSPEVLNFNPLFFKLNQFMSTLNHCRLVRLNSHYYNDDDDDDGGGGGGGYNYWHEICTKL